MAQLRVGAQAKPQALCWRRIDEGGEATAEAADGIATAERRRRRNSSTAVPNANSARGGKLTDSGWSLGTESRRAADDWRSSGLQLC
jgi:hypothetical protein